ncbi:MAG: ComEC/Rec2 family competence protein, partial [Planctomycetota bacterium]
MEAARRDKARQRQANGPLVAAALSAVAGGLLARELGLVAAAAAFAAAALLTVWHRRPGPWLLLAPAALAAAAPTASHHPAVPPHPAVHRSSSGTVRFAGEVLTGVRWDPVLCQESFRLAHQHQVWLCVVQGRTRALPGDLVRGIGRATSPPDDGANRSGARPHRLPRVLTTHDAVTVVRGRPSPARFAEACRLRMQDALLQAIPGEHGVLLAHLVLGRGPALPDDLVAAHRATGLSHLLAVSGAHATMLAWMLGLLFWLATSRSPLTSVGYRRIAAAILLLYGGITGMEPPVFRALVATFVFFLCAATNRRLSVGTVLALPALFTAVLMPRDLFGVSFNLSYAAVFGLALSGVLHKGTLQRRLLMAPLVGSMWATLTTMPLTLWYFGQFAPWTILATPLLSPLIAMMLGLGLVAGGLGAVAPGLADGVVLALALPLQGMTFLYCESVRLIACLPLAPVFAGPRPDLMVLGALGL